VKIRLCFPVCGQLISVIRHSVTTPVAAGAATDRTRAKSRFREKNEPAANSVFFYGCAAQVQHANKSHKKIFHPC
jgi:hypothetical protein